MSVYDLNRIHYPDTPTEFVDDTADTHFVPAPCQAACPVGTDAPSYIGYIWEGKLKEAFEAITATNPFSSICGRVCDAPCEPACRRAASDGPIMIRNLKRYVMDAVGNRYDPAPVPVTKKQTVAIVGAGPSGLTAAHDLSVAGYEVHVYEMTDRIGGLMVWGVPAFRLPHGVIEEDIDRLIRRCPGLKIHLNCALGTDIHLGELKERHDAVLLTIGAWWGKLMNIPGEEDDRVVDGIGFLKRVNGGERPTLPETVVVIGGGDVAMDACRIAKRLPGCKHVKVVYRRGPQEIPARKVELEGAIKEGIEFVYHTLQQSIAPNGDGLQLHCGNTELGEPDEDGRRSPVPVSGSGHDIPCGMVIAAVGQQAESEELDHLGMMAGDRINADFEGMRTGDARVFAAGDGAFGGSTIVMAMHHGQRAAYYIKSHLEGIETPLAYRTPYRTRRVPIAQDLKWELLPVQEPAFLGLGKNPIEFPEIEETYNLQTARDEAARCYRCDAETGSADYSVEHREDIFSMARTQPGNHPKLKTMLQERLQPRRNPFPRNRPATLDDLVFLPANLSRLVIDPYREACAVNACIGNKLELAHPFLLAGFDDAPEEVRRGVGEGLKEAQCSYIGERPIGDNVTWLQLVKPQNSLPNGDAAGLIYVVSPDTGLDHVKRMNDNQVLAITVSHATDVKRAILFLLENNGDAILIDGSGSPGSLSGELNGPPDLSLLRDTILTLRELNREEHIDVMYSGGIRSGTDAAKLIALGAKAIVLGVTIGLAVGGEISEHNELRYASNFSDQDRCSAVANIIRASSGEASMMARCTGKTKLHNLEPEDLRSITLETADAAGVPLVGIK